MTDTSAATTVGAAHELPAARPVIRTVRGLSDRAIAWWFILPSVCLLLAINIFPLLWTVYLSFTDYRANQPGREIKWIGLRNYERLLANEDVWGYLQVTAHFVCWSIFFQVVLGLGLALLINRQFRSHSFWTTLILLPMMLSPAVVGVFWKYLFQPEAGIFNYIVNFFIGAGAIVRDPTGLHARPAVKLTKLAKQFEAEVRVRAGAGGDWVNAKSPNRVMKLKARHGETVIQGIPAARGLAIGSIALRRAGRLVRRVAGTPGEERAALEAAMAKAGAELEALAARAEPMAAAILEFQTALLEDNDLTGPIFDRVAAGEAAHRAWAEVLGHEIAEYAAGDDETFATRAGDLADLRDRVLDALAPGAPPQPGNGADHAFFVAEDLTPSRFLETDWTRYCGAALKAGSPAGHVALLARARGTPLVVGLGDAFERLADGAPAVLDGEAGRLIVNPDAATLSAIEARLQAAAARTVTEALLLDRPAATADGERVLVLVNVDDPALLATLDPRHCDGVGLTRTEFLFQGTDLPDEATQLRAYAEVLRWAAGRPVIIRTLDAGGDKPIPGLTPDHERNPFLGLRGLRLSLARPDVFRVQLRALARAAAQGPLKVMAPMVSAPDEFATFRALFEDVLEELSAAGVAAARPALGMMVEVPAAALNLAAFDADFFSIGSNDLVQYVMAASRDEPAVANLYRPCDPAVLELIRRVVEVGKGMGREVSLCGEMAAEPALVPLLLAAGLRRLSVAPAAIGGTKAAIAAWRWEAPESGRHG